MQKYTNLEHDLWKDGDDDIPKAITDNNGAVVLGLCKVCGGGECELATNCPGRPLKHGEGDLICAGELDF